MAPAQLDAAPISITQEHKPIMTKENKPPIPVGAGAKKAMDSYFTGINSTSSEFRQRSSSSSRTVLKSSSRGTTPSRDLPSTSNRDNCVDVETLANALKKMPGLERNVHRPTPPRSRSISRAESPLPDAEMLDESLPDFYKVTLKKTDRTGSQTRDIVLDGHRQTSQAQRTPSVEPQMQRFRRGSFSGTSLKDGEEANLPEFKRVALKRTPSREQLDDEATHRASTRKSNIVKEKSISRCGSYSSLTSINKTLLSRRSSVSEDRPEFLDVRLKKAGSRAASPDGDVIDDLEAKSSNMSRSGSYTSLANINRANWSRRASLSSSDEPAFKGVALKKTGSKQDLSQNDLRSRASATPEPEFANVSLKKSKRVQGEQSKFELESVSLKPIPVGGVNEKEKNEFTSMERVSGCRVERITKFESGDDEYENIQSSLNRLKGVQIEESEEEREKRKKQERKEREERDREKKEREEKAKLEREAREKADKEARERREKRAREQKERAIKEQKEKEEMEKKLKAEMEQKREELERIRKEKEERARAEKEQRDREMKEQEEKQKKEREERLRKEKEEKEQKQQEERERKEQLKKQETDIAEEERKVREEQKEKEKQERKEKIRLEIEGKVKHKAEEKERKEKEREERVEEKLKLTEDAEDKTVYYRRKRSSEEKESSKPRRNSLIKRMSFTSSENINLSSQPDTEKVHLSVFSREMGSNHDLVQICQDQGQGKHEVKLQFMLGQREEEQKEEQKEEESEEEEETSEEVVVIQRLERTESRLTKAFEDSEELVECSGIQSGSTKLNPLRKAPSVDGLFQTQEVNAAFTFKLPPEQQQQPKLSFQLPTIA